eukprot:TRINITY_DN71892_c0_g1_i1.p2 TRINITY_DN71892_c0_g1~~TRINITY_DN71892_c0_g1_i1.p2  ORF type:complete len:228 (+),score=75.37 TRINITY_DN71892_c0_g1_i1:89-772(+)
MAPHVESFPVPPLQCNCTIVGDTETGDAVVVDPGGNVDAIISKLEAKGLRCVRVLVTHGHLDHIMGAGELKRKAAQRGWGDCVIMMHENDLGLWQKVEAQCSDFGIPPAAVPLPDRPDAFVADNDVVQWTGDLTVRCVHTPGHTQGSTSYLFEQHGVLCPGDTLFRGSIGRTQWQGLPSLQGTSDQQQEIASIRHKLFTLDPSTKVVAGHGPHTTIAHECQNNMMVR